MSARNFIIVYIYLSTLNKVTKKKIKRMNTRTNTPPPPTTTPRRDHIQIHSEKNYSIMLPLNKLFLSLDQNGLFKVSI